MPFPKTGKRLVISENFKTARSETATNNINWKAIKEFGFITASIPFIEEMKAHTIKNAAMNVKGALGKAAILKKFANSRRYFLNENTKKTIKAIPKINRTKLFSLSFKNSLAAVNFS